MLNYFCPKCGGKNLYQFQKPKFCSHCGSSFSVQASTTNTFKSSKFEVNISKPQHINIENNSIDNINNYNEDDEENLKGLYSSMRGLDVDIENNNPNNGIKLGDLITNSSTKKPVNKNKKQSKPRGRKKIIKTLPESFASEASMVGRNRDIDLNIQDIED